MVEFAFLKNLTDVMANNLIGILDVLLSIVKGCHTYLDQVIL